MDIALYVILVLAVGLFKYFANGGDCEATATIGEDGTIHAPESFIPIGSNPGLKRDSMAFTFIIRQLGLVK